MESPLEWWRSWKEMLGNKNIDPRIYDVLGELIVLKTMIPLGEDISWNVRTMLPMTLKWNQSLWK